VYDFGFLSVVEQDSFVGGGLSGDGEASVYWGGDDF
jgi:hypothetical protein